VGIIAGKTYKEMGDYIEIQRFFEIDGSMEKQGIAHRLG